MARLIPLVTSAILVFSAAVGVAACAGGAPPAPTSAPAKPAATTAPATTAPTAAVAPTTAPTVAVSPTAVSAPTAAGAAPTKATSPAGTPEAETAGQEQYEANCAACHGPNGAGGLKIGSATSADIRAARLASVYKNDNALISGAILNGKDEEGKDLDTAMPRFQGKLTAQQVTQIIAFLKTLK